MIPTLPAWLNGPLAILVAVLSWLLSGPVYPLIPSPWGQIVSGVSVVVYAIVRHQATQKTHAMITTAAAATVAAASAPAPSNPAPGKKP